MMEGRQELSQLPKRDNLSMHKVAWLAACMQGPMHICIHIVLNCRCFLLPTGIKGPKEKVSPYQSGAHHAAYNFTCLQLPRMTQKARTQGMTSLHLCSQPRCTAACLLASCQRAALLSCV